MNCDYHTDFPCPAEWLAAFGRLDDMTVLVRLLCGECLQVIVDAGTLGHPLPLSSPDYGPWRFDDHLARKL